MTPNLHLGDLHVSALELFVLFVCLVLSAAFSGAETSLAALSEAKAKALVEKGGWQAKLLRLWVNKPHHVLTATLIGDHAANTVIAVVASLVAERAFQSFAVTIGVAIAVVLVLVFGEITPRSFAKTHAMTLAPLLMPFVWVTYVLTWPLVMVFTRVSHVLVRLSGGTITRSGPFVTEEDIVSTIQLASKEGVLDKHEGKMLAAVFDLGETLVREVMKARTEISALPITATLDEVLLEVKRFGHSRMPVYDDTLDEVKGVFHTRDLLNVLAEKKAFNLKEHLRPIIFVPELMRVNDLLKILQKKQTHLAVVVDEYGGTSGIVALEDVLEQIVGPIHDEHDEADVPIKRLDDGRFTAEGRAGLYELGEVLGIGFPSDQGYETVGGFMIARVGRMPQKGDRVVFGGHTFVVRDADEKRVARVDIERTVGSGTTQPPVAATTTPGELAEPAALQSAASATSDGEPSGPIKLIRVVGGAGTTTEPAKPEAPSGTAPSKTAPSGGR